LDVHVGNGAKVTTIAVDTFHLPLPLGLVLELNNCYCIPALCKNIITSSCLEEVDGYEIIIENKRCSIYYNDISYAHCPLVNVLYVLDLENINAKRARLNDLNPTFIWHYHLDHINEKCIGRPHKDSLLNSFDFESFDTCESYLLRKMTKSPFTAQSERASDLLGFVHTNVCGPMRSVARGGFQHFITFINDFSRYGYIYLMRHKSESFEKFKEFQNKVQNQLGKTIKFLRSDCGGEYLSLKFSDHLKQCEIVPQLTPPGMPHWNGVSKRRNRTLLDMVRSMMSQTDLSLSFWGYALEIAAFILNRVLTKFVERTPYEIWTGKRPGLSFFKVWGCGAYVKRLMSNKLTPKLDKRFFVGYPRETKGYYFYNKAEGKVFVARNDVFMEKEFLSIRVSGSKVPLEEIQETPQNV
jgi:hypothetical protein